MSVKSQLNAARDFLLTGMRASARVQTQNPIAEKKLKACLDLIETLVRQPAENVTMMDVETTLNEADLALGLKGGRQAFAGRADVAAVRALYK